MCDNCEILTPEKEAKIQQMRPKVIALAKEFGVMVSELTSNPEAIRMISEIIGKDLEDFVIHWAAVAKINRSLEITQPGPERDNMEVLLSFLMGQIAEEQYNTQYPDTHGRYLT